MALRSKHKNVVGGSSHKQLPSVFGKNNNEGSNNMTPINHSGKIDLQMKPMEPRAESIDRNYHGKKTGGIESDLTQRNYQGQKMGRNKSHLTQIHE